MHTLLVTTDNDQEATAWTSLFRTRGYHVERTRNGMEVPQNLPDCDPSVIVLDERGATVESFNENFETLRQLFPYAKMIGISGANACSPTVTLADGGSRVSRVVTPAVLPLLVDMLVAPKAARTRAINAATTAEASSASLRG